MSLYKSWPSLADLLTFGSLSHLASFFLNVEGLVADIHFCPSRIFVLATSIASDVRLEVGALVISTSVSTPGCRRAGPSYPAP